MTSGQAHEPVLAEVMPAAPMRAVARTLQDHGWTVRTTGHDDSRLLKVTGKGAGSWEVVVADDCCFTCQYTPRRHHRPGPAGTARIIAHMLGTGDTSPPHHPARPSGLTLPGVVGGQMRAAGMTVTLQVIEDNQALTVSADIAITNPSQPGRGTVYLDNNGTIYWENDTSDHTGQIAATIAGVLTHSTPQTRCSRLAHVCRRRLHAVTRRPGIPA